MKKLTKEEVHKKYKGMYIEFLSEYDYDKHITLYQIIKTYPTIHENTTLGQDVGTPLEYCR